VAVVGCSYSCRHRLAAGVDAADRDGLTVADILVGRRVAAVLSVKADGCRRRATPTGGELSRPGVRRVLASVDFCWRRWRPPWMASGVMLAVVAASGGVVAIVTGNRLPPGADAADRDGLAGADILVGEGGPTYR